MTNGSIAINDLKRFLAYPLNSADEILSKFAGLSGAIPRGTGLQRFVFVEGSRENRVLLVAHADTYWDSQYGREINGKHDPIEHNGVIKNEDCGLGADDRAGCAIVWLLKDMGHSILITNGEERGRKGSNYLMDSHFDIAKTINYDHQFVVQFDRANSHDFKCYDVGTDSFREYIISTTQYSEPDRCSFTDIVTLCRAVCGVNLSIGYHEEHTAGEYLVVDEWLNTLTICREWLSATKLPRFDLHTATQPNN